MNSSCGMSSEEERRAACRRRRQHGRRPSPPRANRIDAGRRRVRRQGLRNAPGSPRSSRSGRSRPPQGEPVSGRGRSSGSWTGCVGTGLLLAASRDGLQCDGEGRFHIPLRGSAGFPPASLLILSLHSDEEIKTSSGAKIAVRAREVKRAAWSRVLGLGAGGVRRRRAGRRPGRRSSRGSGAVARWPTRCGSPPGGRPRAPADAAGLRRFPARPKGARPGRMPRRS